MLHTHSYTARGVKVKEVLVENNILFRASDVSMCDKTPSPAAPVSLFGAKRPKQTSISSGESDALSPKMLLPSGGAECPMRQTVIAKMEIENDSIFSNVTYRSSVAWTLFGRNFRK